jgi:hypothetical protein
MATNPKKEKLALLRVEQLKPKAKRLGVKLTNPSGNAKTKAQLINAIVKAEEKKPAAKKPAAKRRAVKKTLTKVVKASVRRDRERQALPPGRRVSKGGKVYNERRANRADIKQGAAKGQMLGEKYQGWTNYWTWKYNLELLDVNFYTEMLIAGQYKTLYELAEDIKQNAESLIYDYEDIPQWAQGWLDAAFDEINWREIAKNMTEDYDYNLK